MRKLLILFSFCLVMVPAQAQLYSTAPITITPGTQVSFTGDLTSQDSLVNQGDIYLAGDWQNNGTFVSSQGRLFLQGGGDQYIASHALIIHHVHIGGGGEKVFDQDLTITGQLQLSDGYLTPLDTQVHIIIGPQAEITGGSTDAFVNGMLYLSGQGPLYYPIGKDRQYLPLELYDVRGNAPIIGFEAHEPNPNAVAGIGLAAVSERRYWHRNILAGSFEPTAVILPVLNDEGFEEEDQVVVTEAENLTNGFRSLGQADFWGSVMDGTITSLNPGLANYYALGYNRNLEEQMEFYIPSALSPFAGDPNDAVIKIYSADLRSDDFIFRVYNKRGELVFESLSLNTMMNQGWDGSHLATGELIAPGIYTYTMTCKFINGQILNKTGTISMIR